jgi:hypothetical protein
MATVANLIGEHDVVELLDSVGGWPKGRQGTVVDQHGNSKLIEISDERGQMLDLVTAPAERLRLVEPAA